MSNTRSSSGKLSIFVTRRWPQAAEAALGEHFDVTLNDGDKPLSRDALIFLLGWPLEWVPIVLIIVPILIPVLIKLDVNLVWFGILVAVNLQTAWLSPPVALSAYFLKGVVPELDLKDIYLGMMQFMVIKVIGLILIFVFPQIALWLPTLIYGE